LPDVASVELPQAQPPSDARPAAQPGFGWLTSLQSLATTVVIAVFVITFLVQAFQIPSESMENTLLIGDYLLVDKVHFANGGLWAKALPYSTIRRGDIIVFRYPVHPDQHFVKRVVALPGDRVRLVDKHLLVNGRLVREPYAVFQAHDIDPYRDNFPQPDLPSPSLDARWWQQMRTFVRGGELHVPPDCYFVLGDNRDFSLDSRYWGFVPHENVIGRPLVIYLSLRSLGEEDAPDGKLAGIGFLGQLLHLPRWGRTFRIVQ
jgi:signal peptidase I